MNKPTYQRISGLYRNLKKGLTPVIRNLFQANITHPWKLIKSYKPLTTSGRPLVTSGSEIKKEADVNEEGQYIIKKVTLEKEKTPEKKIWGMVPKDFSDLVLKIIGLIALVTPLLGLWIQVSKDTKQDLKDAAQAQRDSDKQHKEALVTQRKRVLDSILATNNENRQDIRACWGFEKD